MHRSPLHPPQDAGLYGFQNIKRWTASLRCLDQDYIFVPIHGAMHWSLAVICHPGSLRTVAAAAAPAGASAGALGTSSAKRGLLVLHLDPLQGNLHNTDEITALLTGWLRQESAREGLHISVDEVAAISRGVRVCLVMLQTYTLSSAARAAPAFSTAATPH